MRSFRNTARVEPPGPCAEYGVLGPVNHTSLNSASDRRAALPQCTHQNLSTCPVIRGVIGEDERGAAMVDVGRYFDTPLLSPCAGCLACLRRALQAAA
jgi:hypothetical protein